MGNKPIKFENVTFGSDPEVFVVDIIKPDRYISSIGLIGGSKDNPRDVGDGIFLQEDNVAVEYCIKPCETKQEFQEQIRLGLSKITQEIEEKGLKLSIIASAQFEDDQLLHPNSMAAGCNPDFNAWTRTINDSVDLTTTAGWRSTGGHIHIGYKDPDLETSLLIIKAMDLFLGVPSVLMDDDIKRRELYGKAGCFRTKDFGKRKKLRFFLYFN